MSLVTLQNGILEVTISSKGAELQSIRDTNGVERLWQGDPAFWTGRAPILFPVAGGFREDAYELDGKRYPMIILHSSCHIIVTREFVNVNQADCTFVGYKLWQATKCWGDTSTNSGFTCVQISVQRLQRVWKGQPLGACRGLGISPFSTMRFCCLALLGSGAGTALSSEMVYGCRGW